MLQNLKIKKVHPDAKLPVKSTNYAAAYDLYALENGIVKCGEKTCIRTGISIRVPQLPPPLKVYGSIRSRSGLSARNGIEVGAGVIDFDYSQELRVILYNHTEKQEEQKKDPTSRSWRKENGDYVYKKHDRIAQLILEVHVAPDIEEVEELLEVEDNNRVGGFGSTGL